MKTFKEFINERSFFDKLKASAKRVFSGGEEKTFIAPLLKGTKPFKGDEYKEYKLFVDYTEGAVYYKNKEVDSDNLNSFSLPSELLDEAHKLVLKYEKKLTIEEDDKNKFYLFVTGIGKESDIKDFCKEVLGGVDYKTTKWDI